MDVFKRKIRVSNSNINKGYPFGQVNLQCILELLSSYYLVCRRKARYLATEITVMVSKTSGDQQPQNTLNRSEQSFVTVGSEAQLYICRLDTSDAADDVLRVDLGGRLINKKDKDMYHCGNREMITDANLTDLSKAVLHL